MKNLKMFREIMSLAEDEKIAIADKTPKAIYLVSSYGRIFSLRIIEKKPNYNKKGNHFSLRNEEKNLSIHRLVGDAFIPNPENKPQINHKDGNRRNNHVNNLEWCTARENMIHAYKNGLSHPPVRRKFTDNQIRKVVKLIKEDKYTYVQAGLSEGMSYSTVAHIMTGRRRNVEGINFNEKNKS